MLSGLTENVDRQIEALNEYNTLDWRHMNVLDKLNAPKLAELCVNTVPIIGHALFISDLVLEMVHRVFEKWLEASKHHDSHISAV